MENEATEDLQLDRYLEKRSDLINRMAKDSSGVSVIEWYDKEATLYDDVSINIHMSILQPVVLKLIYKDNLYDIKIKNKIKQSNQYYRI